MIATVASDELHVTTVVRSCVLPSVYVPVALNCCVVPRAIVGLCGVIAIDASTAGFTISGTAALTPPELIPIVVVPVPSVVASPAVPAESLMVATVATVELQCPDCVTSWVVPSVNVPVAVNCCVMPNGIVGASGLIVIDTSAAAVTVRTVELLMPPELAVMVAVPIPTLLASPAALIVAVVSVSEDQVTVLLRFCVLPSVNVPVAVNCCVVPNASAGVAGETASETSAAEVTVSVVDPVTDPTLAVIVAVPCPILLATPCKPAALLIVATAGVSELHCTVPVMFCMLPSL
jgi:hypothetical protein